MWSTIFVIFKTAGDIRKFVQRSIYLFFDALFIICHLLQIKDDVQVVSESPCLLGHPVQRMRI